MEPTKTEEFLCNICGKSFNSYQSLGAHCVSHTKRNLVSCEICNKRFGKAQIENHLIICKENFYKKNYCKQCNIEINKNNIFCSKSCSNIFRKPTAEHKLRTSLAMCGRQYNKSLYEPKKCKYCEKDIAPIEGIKTPTFCKPKCNESLKHLSYALSNSLKGKTGGYREGGGRGKGEKIDGVWFDSTWEIKLARRLTDLQIKWSRDYKNHKFVYFDENGKKRKYYPDFYLDDFNAYIEVKGYWTSQTKHKMEQVKINNPGIKIIILESLEDIQNFKI